jgi:hypothetical protein
LKDSLRSTNKKPRAASSRSSRNSLTLAYLDELAHEAEQERHAGLLIDLDEALETEE